MTTKNRIGIGFDMHAFGSKTKHQHSIHLCGVKINHTHPIIAHSDGDVALHALTDAMFGAIAEGSIGLHFPPTDPQWKNMNSMHFVKFANNLIKQKNYQISNIDITIICEAPKIMPYAVTMRNTIANAISLQLDQINVKAVTTEHLGALGRKEGIAAQAVCCIY